MLLEILIASVISISVFLALFDLAADTVELNQQAVWMAAAYSALIDLEGRHRIAMAEGDVGVPSLSGPLCPSVASWLEEWCQQLPAHWSPTISASSTCAAEDSNAVQVHLFFGVHDCSVKDSAVPMVGRVVGVRHRWSW